MRRELLEVVDDQGRVLHTADRSEVYKQGWRHRAVHVLLFDDQQRLLVQRRSAQKATWPGCWDLSMGETMKPGEMYEPAARRGLREELHITDEFPLVPVHQHYLHTYHYQDYQVVGLITLFAGVFTGAIKMDQEEVATTQWLSVSEVTALVSQQSETCTPWFIDDWRYTIPRLPTVWKKLA